MEASFAIWPAVSYLLHREHWMRDMHALLVAAYVAVVSALALLMRWIVGEPE